MKKINCVLLVDDYTPDNDYHKIIIEQADVCSQTKVTISGGEALAYMNESGEPDQADTYPVPDLLFLDINMPGLNGFDFLEEFEKLEARLTSKTKIIMLTTSFNPEDRTRALEYKHVIDFQQKPLTAEKLLGYIDKYF